jgi:predicted RNA polymerase sigma factor
MVNGPRAGLEKLRALDEDPRMKNHYRLDAVRAHLYERLGDNDAAALHYRKAADRTASTPERDYLMRKLLASGLSASLRPDQRRAALDIFP